MVYILEEVSFYISLEEEVGGGLAQSYLTSAYTNRQFV